MSAPCSINDAAAEREAWDKRRLRDQSLGMFLKRQRTKQPSHACQCGRTISGNKTHCANCAPKENT